MPKIKLVYQDCPMCGSREEWGERQVELAGAAGLEIEKISFASPEGSHLCKEAIFAGIKKLPFFTDGLTFRESIDDFAGAAMEAKKPEEKPAKKKRTTRKKTEAKK